MQQLYNLNGNQLAFVDNDSVYYNSGKLLGVIQKDNKVYGSDGGYVGEIRKGLLLKKANVERTKIPILSNIPQTSLANRVPGIKRMRTLLPLGYISVLG